MIERREQYVTKDRPTHQPVWVCMDCGAKYGAKLPGHVCTWHEDTCEVCGKFTSVTEPRDFGYLSLWHRVKAA